MYVCVYICVYVYICVCIYVDVCMYSYIYVRTPRQYIIQIWAAQLYHVMES
jgi:hypothetical protein